MTLTQEQSRGIGIALNEAALVAAGVDPASRQAMVTFDVLTLPADGSDQVNSASVRLVLSPIGRVAVSLRLGAWHDLAARVVPCALDELPDVVQSFGGQPVYGWEFVDLPQEKFAHWADRLSLDFRSGGGDGLSHTLDVFQEDDDRILDMRVWFDHLTLQRLDGSTVPLEDFIDGGVRWWDALDRGDPRTKSAGIVPLKGDAGD